MAKLLLPVTMVLFFLCVAFVWGEVSLGVKKGDWIEYQVSTTGTPEDGHDVIWVRMEILDIAGGDISVNVITKDPNGTFNSGVMVLNPSRGEVGVWFIIPANLDLGDEFYDAEEDEYVDIEVSEQRSVAGASRTITQKSIPERIKSWDKSTGVFVGSIDTLENYTLTAHAYRTNMWNSQIFGVDSNFFYLATMVFIVTILVVMLGVYYKKKKKPSE